MLSTAKIDTAFKTIALKGNLQTIIVPDSHKREEESQRIHIHIDLL